VGLLQHLRDEYIRQRLASISQRLGVADLAEAEQQALVSEKRGICSG